VAGLVIAGIRRRFAADMDGPLTWWARIGAVAGLAGIAARSTVEFSLQMPGDAVLFVLLLGVAMHRPRSEARTPSDSPMPLVAVDRHAYRV
jgi:hypothetical protein